MATKTLSKTTEESVEPAVAPVVSAESKVRPVHRETDRPGENQQVHEREIARSEPAFIEVQASGSTGGFLARAVTKLVAFHDWLGGPPMTERDRSRRKLQEAQRDRWHVYL